MDEFQRHDGSFVIRIWWEHSDTNQRPRLWRGWAQHVRNGRQVYFQSFEALALFIEQETGAGDQVQHLGEGIG
jgi:hypothetical protein